MKSTKTIAMSLVMGTLLLALFGCEGKEGPAEQAGKEVDKATEQAGEKMEQTGEDIQDAAKGEGK